MNRFAVAASSFAVTLGAASARADNGETKCKADGTQLEINLCASDDFRKADAELNATYKKALAFARQEDADLKDQPALQGAVKALKKAQRAWIDYRDGQCEGYGFGARGGSMEPLLVLSCKADVTRRRTHELKELMAYPEEVPENAEGQK